MENNYLKINTREKSLAKELERLISKLIRVSIIKPGSNAFIKSLRKALFAAVRGIAILDDTCILDLKLWLDLIDQSIEGTSLLKLIWCLSSIIFFVDASGIGLGRYDLFSSLEWNFELPPNLL